MPELYDLRFRSGVVRDDEGVTLLRGSMEGDGFGGRVMGDRVSV